MSVAVQSADVCQVQALDVEERGDKAPSGATETREPGASLWGFQSSGLSSWGLEGSQGGKKLTSTCLLSVRARAFAVDFQGGNSWGCCCLDLPQP